MLNQKLAHNLIHQSVRLQPGEKILNVVSHDGKEIDEQLIEEAYLAG